MEHIFIQSFIPKATILPFDIGKGINCYQSDDAIFVLANASLGGLITKKIKEKAIKKLKYLDKHHIYVSIYNKRDDFNEALKIAWGTYVWFADAPKHTIHFDDNPQAIKPYTNNKQIISF